PGRRGSVRRAPGADVVRHRADRRLVLGSTSLPRPPCPCSVAVLDRPAPDGPGGRCDGTGAGWTPGDAEATPRRRTAQTAVTRARPGGVTAPSGGGSGGRVAVRFRDQVLEAGQRRRS